MAEQGDSGDDEGLEMLSRLFEEEVSQQEMLEQLILPVPSSVEEQLHRHYENVLARNEELEGRLIALEQENKTLQEKNGLLRNNLTALYRTSLAEIRFRNLQIASLRKQLQLPVTASERRMSSDTDQSSFISKLSMERFYGSGDQGSVSGVSRTEIISTVSDSRCKGPEKTNKKGDLMTDTFSSELNLCVSSSSSVNSTANTCSSFNPQLSSSKSATCGLTDGSSIISRTYKVSVHSLDAGHEAPVSSGIVIPVQPPVSKCYLLKPENQKSQNLDAFSEVDCSMHNLPSCSSLPCTASEDSVFQGVEPESSLLSSNPVTTSDLTPNSLQKSTSSGRMLNADREEKSKTKGNNLGISAETKLVNLELLSCSTTTSGKSKSNVKDYKRNSDKELQSNFAVNTKPNEISLHLAKCNSNKKAAHTRREVSSETDEFTVCSEARNDRKHLSSSAVMPNKTDTSKQAKVSLSSSVECSKQFEFCSDPGSDVQDSTNRKTTTQRETLVSKAGIEKNKSHFPVEGLRTKDISSSPTRQRKDSVESSSHSDFEKIDSATGKTKPKVVPKISKCGSEAVGKHCETSKSETLLHNDLRLKLASKSKADILHFEGTDALCNRLSKNLVESSCEKQGLHKEPSITRIIETPRAGKIDTHGSSVLGLHQETSSHSAHHSHRKKSEKGKAFDSNQSSKVRARDDFRKQESGIENDDQRGTNNCKVTDRPSHKRKLSGSDAELPAKKIRSYESIQERLKKISIMNASASEQPGFTLEESSSTSKQEQRRLATPSSNAKNLVITGDLISRLAPEIEQLKRYMDMAEERDVAQMISLREGEKHLSRLAEQRKMLDHGIVLEAAPVETALQPISGGSQKKPLNDRNIPSLTVFTLRSMAKLKQSSLSKTHKQIRCSSEKRSNKRDCSVRTVSGEATNNPPEVHNLATVALVQGKFNSVSLETSLPKPVCSSQNEKLTVTSENSEVTVDMDHESQSRGERFHINTGDTLGIQSSWSKKPASLEHLNAVQELTSNTPSIQSMEASKTQPSDDVSQNNLIKDVGNVFDSGTLSKRNMERKLNVKQLVDSRLLPSESKTHFGTKQNDEVHTVSQVGQQKHQGSIHESVGNVFDNDTVRKRTKELKLNVKQLVDGLRITSTKQNDEVHAVSQVGQPKHQDSSQQLDGNVFDSDTFRKRNEGLKLNVKQLVDSLRMTSESKTDFGTKQNDEVHAVNKVGQPKHQGSSQQSANGPAETLQSSCNFSQVSKSFSKLISSSTPMEVNADLYLGTKVGKDIHKEDKVRNASSGEGVLSDVDVGVPMTESNTQNPFDFLFDVAITGATPAHVDDNTYEEFESENINFDQDLFANFSVEHLDNNTGDVTEAGQLDNNTGDITEAGQLDSNTGDITEAGQGSSVHTMAEYCGSTRSLKQNAETSNSDRDAECNVVEAQNAFEDDNERTETTAMADNVFTSNPDTSSDKEMNIEHQNLQEGKNNRNPPIQADDKFRAKNLEIFHKIANWSTADVEFLPGSCIEDDDPNPQISPFKRFLHSPDKQCEHDISTLGKPDSLLSPLPHEALLKETASLSLAKVKALQSDEMADLATVCDVACSESELLQVHAPEEGFDFYLSDTNDRLFGSVSESPSSFKSPELEDGAGGMSKTTVTKSTELLNNLDFEEGEINDSEKDFPVDLCGKENSTKSGQMVCDMRSMPRCLSRKKSFNGWHSRGHHYGRSRSEKFSRETAQSQRERIERNSALSQTKQKCKTRSRSPHKSHSPEAVSNASKKGRLERREDDSKKYNKERKDRTRSQERDHSRYSQEHSRCNDRYEHRQRSRICHGHETRRSRVAK